MKAGKVWGQTRLIVANPVLELHEIQINAGGKCSEHAHTHKWNGFYVTSGELIIRTWKSSYDLVDETVLGPGEFHAVQPGEFHQFEARKLTCALELYWAAGLDPLDIIRRSKGSLGQT